MENLERPFRIFLGNILINEFVWIDAFDILIIEIVEENVFYRILICYSSINSKIFFQKTICLQSTLLILKIREKKQSNYKYFYFGLVIKNCSLLDYHLRENTIFEGGIAQRE